MTSAKHASLSRLTAQIGYQFTDESLLRLALTHRSASASHNERLEFLGDSVLGFVVAEMLYTQQPYSSEGDLSRLRASMVSKPALAAHARSLRLGEHLGLGSGESKSGGRDRDSILADAIEAIIAAVYLDGGLSAATELVKRLISLRRRLTDIKHLPKRTAKLPCRNCCRQGSQHCPFIKLWLLMAPRTNRFSALNAK